MDVLKKTPVREQDAKVRATNFEEVCYGYNKEEAMEEASRCLKCKNNAKCMSGCPLFLLKTPRYAVRGCLFLFGGRIRHGPILLHLNRITSQGYQKLR